MKSTTKAIGASIIASVIAGLILHHVVKVNLLPPFYWCRSRIKELGLTIIQPVEIPLAIFGLLLILAAIPILSLAKKMKKESKELSYTDYRQDTFDDMVWRWDYRLNGTVYNMGHYCPKCDTQMVYCEHSTLSFSEISHTSFSCEDCGFSVPRIQGDCMYIFSRIQRLIDRNVRNEHYKAVLERQKLQTSTT
ncbi:hypothetical protein QEH52_18995 [Coraliomargarita sp. SDUM461003]|uniref:Uncharacterized protein n=1 Tax=Thalassobacterium maritimum TaxID=3041265 RepID=A0ABU1AZM4_9BACT|nr:hypothetical protein [Coraliomargarita sp. SDUM461003]MDQ8209614.1 hypothetical protein [Coraliomargarita sp. SDUM461003]